MLVPRFVGPTFEAMLAGFRIVLVEGARQVGKTTFVRDLAGLDATTSLSLDDPATLAAATADPTGLIEALPPRTAIDEYQRGGTELLLAIKAKVDRDATRGQLILTGSTGFGASGAPVETLAGRMGRIEVRPLSVGERTNAREAFIDAVFEPAAWPGPEPGVITRAEVAQLLVGGGYPEVVTTEMTGRVRDLWFDGYIDDVVGREALRPIADVRDELALRRTLRLLAARTSGELVMADLARDADIHPDTAATYVRLLEALHLVTIVRAWASSATTRAKRRPKIVLSDVGLAAALTRVGSDALVGPLPDTQALGRLLETYVVGEIAKQRSWANRGVELQHFRDRNGAKVDLVLEDRHSGEIAGIEVKASATPRARDARHLAQLRDAVGDRFRTGIVLHLGSATLPLGDRLWACPIGALQRT